MSASSGSFDYSLLFVSRQRFINSSPMHDSTTVQTRMTQLLLLSAVNVVHFIQAGKPREVSCRAPSFVNMLECRLRQMVAEAEVLAS
jgi:hypothetical protein